MPARWTVPATIHSGRARNVAAKRSPEKISMDKYKKLKNCKISASTKKASIGCSASGRTNWTKNEMKNKIAFRVNQANQQSFLTNGERTESATRSTRPSWASIVLFLLQLALRQNRCTVFPDLIRTQQHLKAQKMRGTRHRPASKLKISAVRF